LKRDFRAIAADFLHEAGQVTYYIFALGPGGLEIFGGQFLFGYGLQ